MCCCCCFLILEKFYLIIQPCTFSNAFVGLHHVCHTFLLFLFIENIIISLSLKNDTHVMKLFLLELSRQCTSQLLLFWSMVFIYFVTLMGNILFTVIIQVDSHLHTPMYIFLSQLYFLDVWMLHTHCFGEFLEGFFHYIL